MKLNEIRNLRKLINLRKISISNKEKLLKLVEKQPYCVNDPVKIPICTNWDFYWIAMT